MLTLNTLTDDETVAKLAGGIKRWTLPDEFNYIKLYQQVGDAKSLECLAEIALNRQQYPKAAKYYKTLIAKFPSAASRQGWEQGWGHALQQITGNWGRFEREGSAVRGLKADLRYIFRNGKKVLITVNEINTEKLIADMKAYYQQHKADGNDLLFRHEAGHIDRLGWWLMYDHENTLRQKYVGKTVKEWSMNLKPAGKHFDTETRITYKAKKSGAYLLRTKMEYGNEEWTVLWLEDTAIVKKTVVDGVLYYIADAETGEPIGNAEVNFWNCYRTNKNTRAWAMVEIKAWVGTSKDDTPEICEWAGKTISYAIRDPKGNQVKDETEVKLDAYGGFTTTLELPENAPLGMYWIMCGKNNRRTFRVEEYKKPEYEVQLMRRKSRSNSAIKSPPPSKRSTISVRRSARRLLNTQSNGKKRTAAGAGSAAVITVPLI
ncbi:MAG: hypothetical protein LBH00_08330 [Planctomycetaceae bacterium]|jgi:hypothetical protein|nr:hypothetical protein [Planctomycetaceae bacterium]